ncbi:MipA/OmpV family protein, partial [Ralstonia solanacearum]
PLCCPLLYAVFDISRYCCVRHQGHWETETHAPPSISTKTTVQKRLTFASAVLLSSIWLLSSTAHADEASYSISLNVGAAPRYQGTDQYAVTVMPGFRADFGNGLFFDPTRGGAGYVKHFANGMFASAAMSYDLGRSDENRYGRPGSDYLQGMGDVKGALLGNITVGSKIVRDITVSATLELPLTNRDRGWSGRLDINAPVVSWGANKITVSPSVYFGSRKYMQTYFGVTPQQAANSGFAPYVAESGIQATSVSVAWRHSVSRNWTVQSAIGATRLLGDAAKSPVVQNKQSYFGGAGVIYTF